ncbi:hypothetical protein [Pantoea dispersa]|uniref:Uncharacterized protein n=1 Tax=Pantoea dispersa TaxID=59814 RepID=A0ABY2ZZE8_9GAMM|nr:hypothetical protein [Pantoea dispersa]TQC75594.1 hypothetical protein FK492_06645 [Pantoea dispersa]
MSLFHPIHYLNHGLRLLFGMHQRPYCNDWDELLNNIITSGKVVDHDDCTITYSHSGRTYEVWVGNKFYAYGHLYRLDGNDLPRKFQRRPTLKTMLNLSSIEKQLENGEFQNFQRAMKP